MASTNILNPLDLSPNARYPSDFGNMRRRTGCRNFLKQLIDESRTKFRQVSRNTTGPLVCDWYFPTLSNSIFDRFGSTIDRDGNVPSLADWTGNELQILHRELDNGAVRVDVRSAERMTATGTASSGRDFLPQINRDLMNRMRLEINRKTGRPVPNNTAHLDVVNPEPRPGFLILPFRWAFSPEYPRFPQGSFAYWSETDCLTCLQALDSRRLSVCRITEPIQSPVVDLAELPRFRVRLESESPSSPSRPISAPRPIYGNNDNNTAVVNEALSLDRIEPFEFEFLPSPVEPEEQRMPAPVGTHKPSNRYPTPETRGKDSTDTDEFSKLFAAIRSESEKKREEALKMQAEEFSRNLNARTDLELAMLKEKVVNAERKAGQCMTERSAMKAELQEAKWNATRLMGDNTVLRKNLTSAQDGIEALNKNLQLYVRANGHLKNEHFVLQGKIEELAGMRKAFEVKQGQLTDDKLRLEKRLEEMEKEMAEVPDNIATLQLRLTDTQIRLESAHGLRADADRRLELANSRLQEQSSELRDLSHELDTMRNRLQTQSKNLDLLEKQHEMSEHYIKELRQEMRRKIAAARKKGEAEGRDKAIDDMGRQHIRTLEVVQKERSEESKLYYMQDCGTQTPLSSLQECGTQTLADFSQDCDTQTSATSLLESGTQTMAFPLRDGGMQTTARSERDSDTQTIETSHTIEPPLPVQKSCDVIPPELPEPDVLSNKILSMLDMLSNRMDSLEAYQILREEIFRRYGEPTRSLEIFQQEAEGILQSTEAQAALGELPGPTLPSETNKTFQTWDDFVKKSEELKTEDAPLSPSIQSAALGPSSPTFLPPWPSLSISPGIQSARAQEASPQTIDPTSLELSNPVHSVSRKSKRRRPLPTKSLVQSSPVSDLEVSYDDESTIIVDTSRLSAPIRKKRRRLLRDG